ncbi:transposase [bacterium]|nr:transposase [bacterium]
MATLLKTLKVRIKDKHCKVLEKLAFNVNQIWNEANSFTSDYSAIPIPEVGYVYTNITAFDLQKQLKGVRYERELDIPSATVQEIIAVHAKARKQFKKSKLRWRTSGGSRRNLGWIPFKKGQLTFKNGQLKFHGTHFKIWDTYGLSKYELRSGSFSQDSRGRWYCNIAVQYESVQGKGTGSIGIDLGLKTTATCSDGTTLERKQFYRNAEKELAKAQRANKKSRVRAIHAKIKNRRLDTNHKFSRKLVNANALIVVGDVSSSKLAKTKMAKSVLDAGWYQLKQQLDYKSRGMQVAYLEVNEAYSTQTCSSCGTLPSSRPKGITGLEIREWTCSCGATHDRDINAAKNILAAGHCRLAVGIPDL